MVLDRRVGLCSVCRNSRRLESGRGSTFWLCELSFVDPRFRKYPPLPVVECVGFDPSEARSPDAAD